MNLYKNENIHIHIYTKIIKQFFKYGVFKDIKMLKYDLNI